MTSPARQEASRKAAAIGRQVGLQRADERRQDYAWLRTEQGLDRLAASARLGVSEATAKRYEAWMKEGS